MMRPDDLSRPLSPGKPARLPGTTLELAKRYLELMRRAKKMRATTVFGPFKAWRTRRLQGQADRTRRSAAEVWGQLYVRFRPLISHALAQARARDASPRPEVTFLSRVVVALEEEIERDDANTCFADLLCKALAVAARPHAGVAQDLRCKVHLRAVMDTCPEDGAVTTIDLLAYLRGEHAHRSGQVAAPLTDLEFEALEEACAVVGQCLRLWGEELDRRTARVLSSQALMAAPPGEVVLAWLH